MKLKKIIFYICILVSIFAIYKLTFKNKINYVSLGDSLAEGRNSYGEIVYGYSDYIADYLKDFNKLNSYVNGFAKSGYKIKDIIDDIENNRIIHYENTNINIRNVLRESNLVTLSIGYNDLIDKININNLEDKKSVKNKIDKISLDFERLLILLKKYAKNQIIVIGYYNSFPYLNTHKSDIDEVIKYFNERYLQICKKHNVQFTDIFNSFDGRIDYLPNPISRNPNTFGYNKIFESVKKYISI